MLRRFLSVLVVLSAFAVMGSSAQAQGRRISLEPVGPITWHRLKVLPHIQYFTDRRGEGYWPNGTHMTIAEIDRINATSNAVTKGIIDRSEANRRMMDEWGRHQDWRDHTNTNIWDRWHYVNTGQDWVEVIHRP